MAKTKSADSSGLNLRQKVEAAMDALGGDPGPKELQEYVKRTYGDDMKYGHVASYKSQINKKRGVVGRRGANTPSGSVDLKDVAAVKALYDRLGAEKLNDILKLFK